MTQPTATADLILHRGLFTTLGGIHTTPRSNMGRVTNTAPTLSPVSLPNSLTPNLENNWWGCNAGPGNAGCGLVTGSGADFNPWIKLLGSATPSSISPLGTSTV